MRKRSAGRPAASCSTPTRSALDPGLIVTGQLQRFGYDAAEGRRSCVYDGALSTAGGTRVETRRFEATRAGRRHGRDVGPALNRAANQVALEVADWIGGWLSYA